MVKWSERNHHFSDSKFKFTSLDQEEKECKKLSKNIPCYLQVTQVQLFYAASSSQGWLMDCGFFSAAP